MDSATVELDHRRGADIEVSLLWHRPSDRLVVVARDHRSGEVLEIPVAHDRALHAFRHPYGYAASVGIARRAGATTPVAADA